MNEHGTKRGAAIAVSTVVILLVCAAFVFLYKTGRLFPSRYAEEASGVTAADLSETAGETSTPQTSEAEETQTQWMPPIEYDAYSPSAIDQQNFNSTVILGNSQAQALSNYGLIKNADFVTKIGLSINHVLTSSDGDAPINKLKGKTYRKAVFVFGENELGWPYPANFVRIYKQVIARVREMNPGVEIYVQGIFPVTAEASEKSTTGVTNENVQRFNAAVEEMCEEIGATFMPVTDAFRDETGALPEGAAFDGVHFGYDLCKVWAGDMSAYIGSGEAETETTTAPETTTIQETTTVPEPDTAIETVQADVTAETEDD